MTNATVRGGTRIDWVDYAKGFCIIFVVGWHSTLGVEAAIGERTWMHWAVSYTTPFRMPDFFLISGLFLARVIDRDWRTYLDRRVLHFVYFYVLWLTIQIGIKAPLFAQDIGWSGVARLYLLSYIDPFGDMWFIYLLPVFFLLAKLLRPLPAWSVLAAGAALEIAHIDSQWTLVLEFCRRFVFFYSGYLFAAYFFRLAAGAQARPLLALGGLGAWAILNGYFVVMGWSALPFVSLALGYVGVAAVVSVSALMARSNLFAPVRYCGEKSLQIYLGFFLPMALTRMALIKSGLVPDNGTVALIVTAAGLVGALVMYWAMRDTKLLGFLYERPQALRLEGGRALKLAPAE
ncbi:MAG: acyltransferase family protein [Proteobacteria bacterium]|nr:acyltransferase family protein [Pseudomonadota bacterium]